MPAGPPPPVPGANEVPRGNPLQRYRNNGTHLILTLDEVAEQETQTRQKTWEETQASIIRQFPMYQPDMYLPELSIHYTEIHTCHALIKLSKKTTDHSDNFIEKVQRHVDVLTQAIERGRPTAMITTMAQNMRSQAEWKFVDACLYMFVHFIQWISDAKSGAISAFPEYVPGNNTILDRRDLMKTLPKTGEVQHLERQYSTLVSMARTEGWTREVFMEALLLTLHQPLYDTVSSITHLSMPAFTKKLNSLYSKAMIAHYRTKLTNATREQGEAITSVAARLKTYINKIKPSWELGSREYHAATHFREAITSLTSPTIKPKIDQAYAETASLGVRMDPDALAEKINVWELQERYHPGKMRANITVRQVTTKGLEPNLSDIAAEESSVSRPEWSTRNKFKSDNMRKAESPYGRRDSDRSTSRTDRRRSQSGPYARPESHDRRRSRDDSRQRDNRRREEEGSKPMDTSMPSYSPRRPRDDSSRSREENGSAFDKDRTNGRRREDSFSRSSYTRAPYPSREDGSPRPGKRFDDYRRREDSRPRSNYYRDDEGRSRYSGGRSREDSRSRYSRNQDDLSRSRYDTYSRREDSRPRYERSRNDSRQSRRDYYDNRRDRTPSIAKAPWERRDPLQRPSTPSWEKQQTQSLRRGWLHKSGEFTDSLGGGDSAHNGWLPVWRTPSGDRFAVRGAWGDRVRQRENQERQKTFFNSKGAKTSYVKILLGEIDRPEPDQPPWARNRSRSFSRDSPAARSGSRSRNYSVENHPNA